MTSSKQLLSEKKSKVVAFFFLASFILYGIALFIYSNRSKDFSDKLLTYDLVWLDSWALAFFFTLVVIWIARNSVRLKTVLSLLSLTVYLVVTNHLLLDGTPYYLFGYGGDQAFRQAIVLKFMAFVKPGDFYFKDLPVFYPPLFYYLQAIYAKIFSIEVYKMSKIAQTLIFVFTPVLLFYIWKKFVTPLQSFLITITTFVYCNFGASLVFLSPHTFLAYTFFIPWLLYYVEQISSPKRDWQFYLTGGLFGALIYLTYSYVLVIGLVYLFIKLAVLFYSRSFKHSMRFLTGNAIPIVAVIVVISAVYWLPLVLSILEYGVDRSRGGWYHIGYVGLDFQFLQFSIPALFYLAAIAFLFRRPKRALNQFFIVLILAVPVLHLIGTTLGALGIDINVTKSTDIFVFELAGPIIGLMVASWFKLVDVNSKRSIVPKVIVWAVLLVCLNNISGLGRGDGVKRARTSGVPNWGTNAEQMADAKGKVFLVGHWQFPSFYPVYSFHSANEHYAHPASQFFARYRFLALLENFHDPLIFYTAFRFNRFDKIEYFMPQNHESGYGLTFLFSNYPTASYTRVLKYNTDCVQDSVLFSKLDGANLYHVNQTDNTIVPQNIFANCKTTSDTLKVKYQLHQLSKNLDDNGKKIFEKNYQLNNSHWQDFGPEKGIHKYSDEVQLTDAAIIKHNDSLYAFFSFVCLGKIKNDYKIYFEATNSHGLHEGFETIPELNSANWEQHGLVHCVRAIPIQENDFDIAVGLFKDSEQLGQPFLSTVSIQSLNQ